MKPRLVTLLMVVLMIAITLSASPSEADIIWDWDFTNSGRIFSPTDDIPLLARLYNNSTEGQTIGGIDIGSADPLGDVPDLVIDFVEYQPLSQYSFVFPQGENVAYTEFSDLDLSPGESFDFQFGVFSPLVGPVPEDSYNTQGRIVVMSTRGEPSQPDGALDRTFTWTVSAESANCLPFGCVDDPLSGFLPHELPIEDYKAPDWAFQTDSSAHVVNLSSGEIDSSKPTIVLVHGTLPDTVDEWPRQYSKYIGARLNAMDIDDQYNILAWDWEKEADFIKKNNEVIGQVPSDPRWAVAMSTSPGMICDGGPCGEVTTSLDEAQIQGNLLGEFLRQEGLTNQLHLIGFSAGGTVVQGASKYLTDNKYTVEHVTLLDAPKSFSGTIYETLTPLNDVKFNTSAQIPHDLTNVEWADNYITELGTPALGAYNKYILPPINPYDIPGRHGYAISYYQDTITNTPSTLGFYWSRAGGGWNDPARNNLPIFSKEETNTVQVCTDASCSSGISNQGLASQVPADIFLHLLKEETFDTPGNWYRNGDVRLDNGVVVLTEGSPAYLFEEFAMPTTADFLSFNFKFTEPGQGDYLALHFNDDLLFAFDGLSYIGPNFWTSGLIPVNQYSGQSGWLTFSLNSTGDRDSQVMIDRFRLYDLYVQSTDNAAVPEPSTLVMVTTGIAGMSLLLRKRRDKFLS